MVTIDIDDIKDVKVKKGTFSTDIDFILDNGSTTRIVLRNTDANDLQEEMNK
jgi:hypothetical protein